jgi:hypothetical protein
VVFFLISVFLPDKYHRHLSEADVAHSIFLDLRENEVENNGVKAS